MTLFQVFQATSTATATAMTEVQQGLDAATNEVGVYIYIRDVIIFTLIIITSYPPVM